MDQAGTIKANALTSSVGDDMVDEVRALLAKGDSSSPAVTARKAAAEPG